MRMETRSKRRGKGPLPGERQGTSEAGVGRDSVRATGGSRLNRRTATGTPERNTADQDTIGHAQDQQVTQEDGDVDGTQRPHPTTPPARGKGRTRWTEEINEYLVRCYLQITKLETIKTPYSKELHEMVTTRYPSLNNKTVQNILDQRRSLFINNRLPATALTRIKREVAIELGMQEDRQEEETTATLEVNRTPNQEEQEFESHYMNYNGMDHLAKPKLPKLLTKANTNNIIKKIDAIIATKINNRTTIDELHSLMYTGAYTVLKLNGQKVTQYSDRKVSSHTPPWEHRMTKKIDKLRHDIGVLTQAQNIDASNKTKKKAATIISKFRSPTNQTIIEIQDLLKQKLAAVSKRLNRYRVSNKRRIQNKQFDSNQRAFYKSIETPSEPNKNKEGKTPEIENVKRFWEGIWGSPVDHKRTKWLYEEKNKMTNLKTMMDWEITPEEVQEAIHNTHNWKAPGQDKLQNYWYKAFKSGHTHLAKMYTEILRQPELMPTFMVKGMTYLLPKTEKHSEDPAKYRPITCLPTIYKILTAILANKIYKHLEHNKLLDEEQKGCRKGSRGCKEQLIIDSIVMNHAKRKKHSLYTAYIDYQKAYDSIPHTWLAETLELYKIETHITGFLKHAMTQWCTTLYLNTPQNTIEAGNIKIQRGIFQGDALSPLWFCLALRPLTALLNGMKKGYTMQDGKQISHLWYMDDLKLFASDKKHLHNLLTSVGRFSSDIQMKFGLDKCKMAAMEKGRWVEHSGFEVNRDQGTIIGMEEDEKYKYLGYLQARGIDHKQAKEATTSTYFHRLRLILKSKLSARNMAKAVNGYATSVLTYSFGVIQWTNTELADLNTKTRKEFRKYRAHHPNSSVERFHLPRNQGGRGIPDIQERHHKQLENLRKYFHEKAKESQLHEAAIQLDKNATPLKLADKNYSPLEDVHTTQEIKAQWRSKPLHGRYLTNIENEVIDTEASTAYLRKGNIFVETEGFIAAIQDQVIPTKIYRQKILRENIQNNKCRACAAKEEYLDHIISGCSVVAPREYLERHNRVAKIVHQTLRTKYMGLKDAVPYYQYEPPTVCEDENIRIYWNRQIITDRTIPNNIPDIVITHKKEKITYVIDIAIPLPANISKTHGEKIHKYLPLSDEIRKMWKMEKVIIIPIVIGATGEIPKKLHESTGMLGLEKELYLPMQKTVLLDTCSIVRRILGDTSGTTTA